LEGLKKLIRLNQYATDPVSKGCPGDAIASRYDLPATGPCPVEQLKANGATDGKATNAKLMARLEAQAVNGPSDDDQPSFNWATTKFKKPRGQPDLWNFKWKTMKPDPNFFG